jgi:hypothetical protein
MRYLLAYLVRLVSLFVLLPNGITSCSLPLLWDCRFGKREKSGCLGGPLRQTPLVRAVHNQ